MINKLKSGYLYTRCDELTDKPFQVLDIVYYAFLLTAGFNGRNNLNPEHKYIRRLTEIILPKAQQYNTKVILSLNNEYGLTAYIRESSEHEIDLFVGELIDLIDTYSFDGYDLAIESFTRAFIPNYVYFIGKLSQELKLKNKMLTGTFRAGKSGLAYFNNPQLHEHFDIINVMTYAMDTNPLKYKSALRPVQGKTTKGCSWEEALTLYDNYVPRDKLHFGFATYVQRMDSTTPYNISIIDNLEEHSMDYDEEAEVAYFEMLDDEGRTLEFIEYENERSLNAKLDFIEDNNLAGIFYWEYGLDDERLLDILSRR